jgi:transmembrane protein 70
MYRLLARSPWKVLGNRALLEKSWTASFTSITSGNVSVSIAAEGITGRSAIRFFSVNNENVSRPSILSEKLKEGMANKFANPDVPKDPEGRMIVYEGALKYQVMKLKFFSLSTSGMGLCMQPIIWTKLAESSLAANIALITTSLFFTFGTPLLIQFGLARKYVTEIYYEPESDTYTAATYNFFNRKREIPFKVEDVVVPDVPPMLTTCMLEQKTSSGTKKIPLFIAPNTFNDPVHYGRIMGYDKPLDFQLDEEVEKVIQEKEEMKKQN